MSIKNTTLEEFTKSDVFTPDKISAIMASKLKKHGSLLDPAVGTGNLLKYIDYSHYTDIDVYEIKELFLDQINKEDKNKNINKYHADFLKANISRKYKNIILNPPYIKIQDLPKEYRTFLREQFIVLKKGLVDIYYGFILKCLSLLEEDGVMVSITPNSYLYNKSALPLRKYLFENHLVEEIIDFGTEKVFPGISAYCCITIFTKKPKEYITYNDKKINMNDINSNDYNIFHMESNTKKTLKNICKITNGIATLRDKIYIHPTKLFDEPCWRSITTSKDIKQVIYPYNDKTGKIIHEKEFKQLNPKTYAYLLENKDELAKRDKGNKTYPEWYSFGRTQSLIVSGKEKVIYIPCFVNPDMITFNISSPLLYQGCLCIEPNTPSDIEIIKKSILKNVDFLKSVSSKRGGGWITMSSCNLYKVPLCDE
jgi:hypothetical protein